MTSANSADLSYLQRAYATLAPTCEITWPANANSEAIHDYVIDHILLNSHLRSYPPATSYQQSFWKWILQNLERENTDVDDRIYEHYLALISGVSTSSRAMGQCVSPPKPSFVTHYWLPRKKEGNGSGVKLYQSSTLLENRTLIEHGTTGLRTWSASLFLARYFASHPHVVQGRVLELGCGTGLLGVVIAQLQLLQFKTDSCSETVSEHMSVCLTDVNEQVLDRCRENLNLHCNTSRLHPHLTFRTLDWTAANDDSRRNMSWSFLNDHNAHVIIGADLVYDVAIIPGLVATLRMALSQPRRQTQRRKAYFALTIRNEATLTQFLTIAGECLNLEEICRSSNYDVQDNNFLFRTTDEVRIYMLTNRTDALHQ